jgi:hypothetical protein
MRPFYGLNVAKTFDLPAVLSETDGLRNTKKHRYARSGLERDEDSCKGNLN